MGQAKVGGGGVTEDKTRGKDKGHDQKKLQSKVLLSNKNSTLSQPK